jgi:virginiamycin B lyase
MLTVFRCRPRPAATKHRSTRRPRLEPLEERCVPTITEFPLPGVGGYISSLQGGPDGGVWFGSWGLSSNLGRFDTCAKTFEMHDASTATNHIQDIAVAPDGSVWYTLVPNSGLVGDVHYYLGHFGPCVPEGQGLLEVPQGPTSLTVGPDGNVWLTGGRGAFGFITQVDAVTSDITTFAAPTPQSFPHHLLSGPQGGLWFSEFTPEHQAKLAKLVPATGAFTEYTTPTPGYLIDGMTEGPGHTIWLIQSPLGAPSAPSQLLEFNPRRGTFREVGRSFGHLQDITTGPDGAIWMTQYRTACDTTYGSVVRYDPATRERCEWAVPSHSLPDRITLGPDGNVWISETDLDTITSKLARVSFEDEGGGHCSPPAPRAAPASTSGAAGASAFPASALAGPEGPTGPWSNGPAEGRTAQPQGSPSFNPWASAPGAGLTLEAALLGMLEGARREGHPSGADLVFAGEGLVPVV